MSSEDTTDSKTSRDHVPSSPLFSWVKAELKAKPDRVPRAMLLLEGAQFLEEVGRLGEAAKAMVAAANSDPLLLPAVWHLIFIFLRRNSWKNVTRLRKAELKAAQLPAEKAVALVSWGELQEDRIGDVDVAADAYAKAVATDPTDRLALLSLARASARAGDLGRLARALQAQIELTSDDRRKALLLIELAKLQENLDQGASSGTLENLDKAVVIESGRWYWLGSLERYAERIEAPEPLARALEGKADIMAAMSDIETVAEALRSGAPRVHDPEQAALMASYYYRRAARLRDRALGQRDAAIGDLERSLKLVPRDRNALEYLLESYIKTERWDDATTLVSARLEEEPDAEDTFLLHLRLSEIATLAERPERAIEHSRMALEKAPTAIVPMLALEKMLVSDKRWEEVADLYSGASNDLADDEPALSALFALRAADVADRHLSDQNRALQLLEGALDRSPNPTLVKEQIVGLQGVLGRWPACAELLQQLVEDASDENEALAHLSDLALIQQVQLDDSAGAASTYGQILDRDPEALWAALARVELYSASERWAETAGALRQLSKMQIPETRAVAALSVAGWLYLARCERTDDAEKCFRAAIQRRPRGALAAAGLEALARSGDDTARLRELLRERADRAESGAEVERLLLALAIEHEKAGDLDDAIEVYRELVERADEPRGGRWSLARCYRATGRWTELAEVYDALDDPSVDSPDRGALLLRLAELYSDRLDQPALAVDTLERARAADADLLPAVLLLADHARLEGAWSDLDLFLQEMLRLAPEAALLVAEERLAVAAGPGQDDAAARVIDDVLLENIPDHRPALVWKSLIGARDNDGQARSEGWRRIAEIEGPTPLGTAIAAHVAVVDEIRGALSTEDALLLGGELSPEIALHLADLSALPVELATKVLAQRRELAKEPSARAFWTLELAAAHEAGGALSDAGPLYHEVLESTPLAVGALEGILRISRAEERWEELAMAAERLAEINGDNEVATRLWVEAAESWHKVDDEGARVEGACRRALDIEPEHRRAFRLLLDILGARGDRVAQLELLERRTGAVDEPAELVALLMVQAGLHRDLQQHEDAAGCLETAILVDPDNVEALRARAALDIHDRRWTGAAVSLEAWAEKAGDEEQRIVRWRASELLEHELDNPVSAMDPLLALVEGGDEHPDTYRRLLYIARRAKAWRIAARASGRLAELTDDDDERLDAFRVHGKILGDLAGEPAAARLVWQSLVTARPDDLEAIEKLLELTDPAERDATLRSIAAHVHGRLRSDPTDPRLIRVVVKLQSLFGSNDGQLCALQVLEALGQLDASEGERLRELRSFAPPGPQRPISPDTVAMLRHPDQTGLAETLVQLLGPVLHKIFGADVSALKLGRPLRARGGDLLVERLEAAAEVFGVERLVVRRSSEEFVSIVPVPALEPTMAVGPSQTGDMPPETRFAVGRALWHILQGTAALAVRTESQIRAFHDAATKEGVRDFQPRERRLGVDVIQREIHRAIPRRMRRPLADLANRLAQTEEDRLLRWCNAMKVSADRAGLLLAGDVSAALAAIVPGWHGADAAQRAASVDRVRASSTARELLVFALSEDYVNLRQTIGLAAENW